MVEQLSASGERGEILPLRRHQLDCPLEIAQQLAIANTLHTVQQGLAIYPRPAAEPGGDHKPDPSDV